MRVVVQLALGLRLKAKSNARPNWYVSMPLLSNALREGQSVLCHARFAGASKYANLPT